MVRRRSLLMDAGRFAKFFTTPTSHERQLFRLQKKRKQEIERARLKAIEAHKKLDLRVAKLKLKQEAALAKDVVKIRKRTKIIHNGRGF